LDLLESTNMGEVMSEVVSSVHSELGVALLTTNRAAPADGEPLVTLLCEVLATCYYVTPDKLGLPALFGMLATYLVHVCASVRKKAEEVIFQFMKNRAGLRALLVERIAESTLQISDLKGDVLELALEKLNYFLDEWNKILGGVSNEDAMELNTVRVEGIALVFLCSPLAKVRLRAWETIERVRTLGRVADRGLDGGGGGGTVFKAEPLRTVMEELEEDIIRTLNEDQRFRRIENPNFKRFINMRLQVISFVVKRAEHSFFFDGTLVDSALFGANERFWQRMFLLFFWCGHCEVDCGVDIVCCGCGRV
jgi:hypothetical protein